jgi:methionyl-tRNA formyltransferase
MKIVYMGTPDFAVPSLRTLHDNGFEVVAVITAPDKPAGRGMQLRESPVKQAAVDLGLKVLQPTNLKDESFQAELSALEPDLGVIVAFRMLPEAVWSMPRHGSINLHGSLLPNYRGAAPTHWAIINGESKTGITTFFLKHEIDTGDLLLQRELPIGPNETAGELHDRMMEAGSDLILETVKRIDSWEAEPKPQPELDTVKAAPKIHKPDCRIDWSQSAQQVHNHIRGLSPFPGAWTTLEGKQLKVLRGQLVAGELEAGRVHVEESRAFVGCNPGKYELLEVQLQGKKRMEVAEFLRGMDLNAKHLT